jgi:hypothetical protein
MEEIVAPLAWNEALESLKLPAVKSKDRGGFIDGISKQLSGGGLSNAERDAALEGREAPNSDVRPAVKRAATTSALLRWLLCLRAYTVALKNLENIPRGDKEKHLRLVLEGWAATMRYACLAFRDIVEEREFSIGSTKYQVKLPAKLSAGLLRFLFLCIPVIVSSALRNDLGTQKLSLLLRDRKLQLTLGASFLQTSLYADMKLNEYVGELKAFMGAASNSQFFLEAMLLKMRDIYVRFGLTGDEQKGFRRLAAELSADLKGLKGEERSQHLSTFANDLDKVEQVAKLREGGG